jgi:hypothetical protein
MLGHRRVSSLSGQVEEAYALGAYYDPTRTFDQLGHNNRKQRIHTRVTMGARSVTSIGQFGKTIFMISLVVTD